MKSRIQLSSFLIAAARLSLGRCFSEAVFLPAAVVSDLHIPRPVEGLGDEELDWKNRSRNDTEKVEGEAGRLVCGGHGLDMTMAMVVVVG